ncbi:MAG TPA: T9SS type A sorting domain-containing protein, partial [Flavobacteriales bacterium]|nr:T9SS type A sorting domain-containing protein [Flavobacteriales bacterium]
TNAGDIHVKYLSFITPDDPNVQHLSEQPTEHGIMKPMTGGSCIDQDNGIFYWVGDNEQIVGANTSDGTFVYYQISTELLLFIEHFSSCACAATGIHEAASGQGLVVFPSVLLAGAPLTASAPAAAVFELIDAQGKVVQRTSARQQGNTQLRTAGLNAGLYLLRASDRAGRVIGTTRVVLE